MFRAVFLPIIRSVISRTTALVQFCAEASEVNKGHWLCECNGVKNWSIKIVYISSYDDKTGSIYKRSWWWAEKLSETCRAIVPLIKIGNLQCICWFYSYASLISLFGKPFCYELRLIIRIELSCRLFERRLSAPPIQNLAPASCSREISISH